VRGFVVGFLNSLSPVDGLNIATVFLVGCLCCLYWEFVVSVPAAPKTLCELIVLLFFRSGHSRSMCLGTVTTWKQQSRKQQRKKQKRTSRANTLLAICKQLERTTRVLQDDNRLPAVTRAVCTFRYCGNEYNFDSLGAYVVFDLVIPLLPM